MQSIARRAWWGIVFSLGLLGCGSAAVDADTAAGRGEVDTDSGEAAAAEPGIKARIDHYQSKAGMARMEGDAQGALEYYLEAAAVCEQEESITVACADVYYETAGMAYERMEKELAIEYYGKAIDIYLRFKGNARAKAAVALNAEGVIYREMAEKSKARNLFEQALQIYEETPEEYKNAANIEKIKQNIRDLEEGYY
ncbi:MAG: tetratricopeptide repeat protein [Polyangia bacterium]